MQTFLPFSVFFLCHKIAMHTGVYPWQLDDTHPDWVNLLHTNLGPIGLDFLMSWIETERSKGVQDRGLKKPCFLVGGEAWDWLDSRLRRFLSCDVFPDPSKGNK
jgi:hypothetical protein